MECTGPDPRGFLARAVLARQRPNVGTRWTLGYDIPIPPWQGRDDSWGRTFVIVELTESEIRYRYEDHPHEDRLCSMSRTDFPQYLIEGWVRPVESAMSPTGEHRMIDTDTAVRSALTALGRKHGHGELYSVFYDVSSISAGTPVVRGVAAFRGGVGTRNFFFAVLDETRLEAFGETVALPEERPE